MNDANDQSGANEGLGLITPTMGPAARLRNYFLTGILVTAPLVITFYAAYVVVSFIDNTVTGLLPDTYNPNTYLPFSVPGVGLIVLFTTLVVIGFLTANFLGRLLIKWGEMLLERMPVIRNVYSAIKQIFETILKSQSTAFRDVVLVEYPRKGLWCIGFVSGTTKGEVQNLTADEMVNVFLPTTPNPTSGFLLFVPRKDMTKLHMTVEEGIKMVVSGGIITPPDKRVPSERQDDVIKPA
ncbi:MAG: DUF502 domain-containing protein [Rhodospirillaceae bacterium]